MSLVVYPIDSASFSCRIFPTSLYLHTVIYMHWVDENRDYWLSGEEPSFTVNHILPGVGPELSVVTAKIVNFGYLSSKKPLERAIWIVLKNKNKNIFLSHTGLILQMYGYDRFFGFPRSKFPRGENPR